MSTSTSNVLGVLEPECFQLRLHLIGDMTERLTPEGRAHNLAIGGEAAIFLALFLKAFIRHHLHEISLPFRSFAEHDRGVRNNEKHSLLPAAEFWLKPSQTVVTNLGQPLHTLQVAIAGVCQSRGCGGLRRNSIVEGIQHVPE